MFPPCTEADDHLSSKSQARTHAGQVGEHRGRRPRGPPRAGRDRSNPGPLHRHRAGLTGAALNLTRPSPMIVTDNLREARLYVLAITVGTIKRWAAIGPRSPRTRSRGRSVRKPERPSLQPPTYEASLQSCGSLPRTDSLGWKTVGARGDAARFGSSRTRWSPAFLP